MPAASYAGQRPVEPRYASAPPLAARPRPSAERFFSPYTTSAAPHATDAIRSASPTLTPRGRSNSSFILHPLSHRPRICVRRLVVWVGLQVQRPERAGLLYIEKSIVTARQYGRD